MSTGHQFGQPLFLKSFGPGEKAEKMLPLKLAKTAGEKSPYDEAWLQRLIMSQPGLLPMDQIGETAFKNLVPICMELPVGSGFADNLLITPEGNIALIECKLWHNPEARREVIAQIIDYAKELSTWTYKDLQDAVRRVKGIDAEDQKTRSLYDFVALNGAIDEASFHDQVSRNLKRGRFLLLVVGDGIQEGAERMVEFLQKHASLHFTLALVELALFEVPIKGYIVQPRVLAKTVEIPRAVIEVDDHRISVKPADVTSVSANGAKKKAPITQELYFEEINRNIPGISQKLSDLITGLAELNVFPEFGIGLMILRWHNDSTDNWNMGTIGTAGQVWMDYFGHYASTVGLLDLSKRFLDDLAKLVPGSVVKMVGKGKFWNIAGQDGKSIRVDALLKDGPKGWVDAITAFQKGVMETSDLS